MKNFTVTMGFGESVEVSSCAPLACCPRVKLLCGILLLTTGLCAALSSFG